LAEQFNVRLPDELARAVRVRAAELGIKPRDVVVEALEAFGLAQVPSNETEAPHRDDDPRPPRRGESGDQRGDVRRTTRGRARSDRTKAGEAGTSGEGASGPARADRPPAAIEKVDHPASLQSACPECAGELRHADDGTAVVCGDCGWRAGVLPGV
jgi:hypothetical protein